MGDLLSRLSGPCLVLCFATACDFATDPGGDEPRVWIGESSVILQVGDVGRLSARYQKSPRRSVVPLAVASWHTSNEGVLRVQSDGSVEALVPGVVTVWTEHGGAADSVTVVVRAGAPTYTTKWAAVAVGDETTCAVTSDGRGYCWGGDYFGAIGDGVHRQWTHAHAPVALAGGIRLSSVAVGRFHACGLTATGEAYCWGDANVLLGADRADPVNVPRRVEFSGTFSRLGTGENHVCALDRNGAAYCWGLAAFGELGDGVLGILTRVRPHPVKTDLRFSQILPGHSRTCSLALSGHAYCWGLGSLGYLGNGSNESFAVPVKVSGSYVFTEISGVSHTCGNDTEGVLRCWGPDTWHQIGTGSEYAVVPVDASAAKQFESVAAGSVTTCGIAADGRTYCWGLDRYGNLGSGAVAPDRCGIDQSPCSRQPLEVAGGLQFTMLSMSTTASCGITVDQALYCWGSNERGQLGNGSLVESSNSPVRVADP